VDLSPVHNKNTRFFIGGKRVPDHSRVFLHAMTFVNM
jgi:hypothetical protein